MADESVFSGFRLGDVRTMNTLTLSLVTAAQSFGKSITTAFAQGVIEGKRFEDVLRGVGNALKQSLLQSAVSTVSGLLSSLLNSGINKLAGGLTGMRLGGKGGPSVSFFADGGVVASPSYFAMGRGLGLMGERGAEAIMPLSRGPDGKLGVRAGGGERRPVSVSVQIATRDADSFRRSEAQISAAIARAVARGHRAL